MANINYTKPDKLEDFSVWCSKKYPLGCKSNFPFIEDTFEALDTYGLICKIVQYLNETKQNLNTTEDNVQNIYNFVTNYFDNLDVQKEINNKLDSMVSSGELQTLLTEQYNSLRNEVNSEISFQNSQIRTINNKINSSVSGSPAGVYDTIEDLMTDDPSHDKIYVVKSDGEWYYWDSSINQWNNGGVYQSIKIDNNYITPEMTTFIEKKLSDNLFDKNAIIPGYFIYSSETPSSNSLFGYYKSEDFINGEQYIISCYGRNPNLFISCFDSSSNNLYKEEIHLQDHIFTVPVGTDSMYISVSLSQLEFLKIEKYVEGQTPTLYTPYKKYYEIDDDIYSNVLDNTITETKTTFIKKYLSSNVLNVNELIPGFYVGGGSKTPIENTSLSYYESKDLEPSTEYITSVRMIVSFWGIYNHIQTMEVAPNNTFITPEKFTNCYISIYNSSLNDESRINKGNILLPFEKYINVNELKNIFINNKNIINNNMYIVDKNGNGNYDTLTEAIKNSKNNDIILVYPGIYENEIVKCWGKKIYIIGIDKNNCIIKNDTCNYNTPPIEFSHGLLKNLTVIAEYNNENYSEDITPPYAVHIEDNSMQNQNCTIENCNLESQLNYGLGIGMRGGCNVDINNCELIGSSGDYIENIVRADGGLFFHDASNPLFKGEQIINIKDTIISTKEKISHSVISAEIRIDSQEIEGSSVNVTFNNCTVINENTGNSNIVFRNAIQSTEVPNIEDLTNFTLNYKSFGNNNNKINK